MGLSIDITGHKLGDEAFRDICGTCRLDVVAATPSRYQDDPG